MLICSGASSSVLSYFIGKNVPESDFVHTFKSLTKAVAIVTEIIPYLREILTAGIFNGKPHTATRSDFHILFFMSTKHINMQNGQLMITKPHYCYYSNGY